MKRRARDLDDLPGAKEAALRRGAAGPLALLWGLAGCGAEGAGRAAALRAAASTSSGYVTQGRTLQGRTLQGRTLQGTSLAGATVQGAAVSGLALEGTAFVGTVNGRALRGRDFIGAVFQELTPEGAPAQVIVRDIAPDPDDPAAPADQLLLYTLTSRDPVTGAEGDACAPDASGDRRALPLAGAWDPQGAFRDDPATFSFACVSGVLAKCVRWGYRPWQAQGGRSLRDYHQACTRMARADYCGDGTSSTQDGTLVDLYDDLQIQVRAPQGGLLFDGAWTPSGAYCIGKERWVTLQNLLSLSCRLRFVNLGLLWLEASPVAGDDLCLLKRQDLTRDAVRLDNRAGVNVQLSLGGG